MISPARIVADERMDELKRLRICCARALNGSAAAGVFFPVATAMVPLLLPNPMKSRRADVI